MLQINTFVDRGQKAPPNGAKIMQKNEFCKYILQKMIKSCKKIDYTALECIAKPDNFAHYNNNLYCRPSIIFAAWGKASALPQSSQRVSPSRTR